MKFGSWVNEHYRVQYRLASTAPDQVINNQTKNVITEDISLKEYDSPIGWKVIGTRAYMESTQHFPPLLEEPAQNMVFSLVFQRDFVFDEYAGVTKRPSAENIKVGMFDYSFLCISKIHLIYMESYSCITGSF